MAVSRIEPSVSRRANDAVYGTGADGTVVIASSASLSRDMYYANLTINSGAHLNTNGFRVFVQNTLVINGTIGVNSSTTISDGTVKGNTPVSTSQTAGIGGNAYGGTYTVSQIPSSLLRWVETALNGAYFNTSGTRVPVTGGAGGGNGNAGTATAQINAGAGGAGTLNRNALAPGGPGTAGTVGPAAPLASAGTGARGGAVVILAAKFISGNGQIISHGQNATAGGTAADGSYGATGSSAPGQAIAHHSDGSSSYITGDGTHGPHASYGGHTPSLPHSGHIPHTSQDLHFDRYVYHAVYVNAPCGDGVHAHGAGHFHNDSYGHYHGYSGAAYDNIRGVHGYAPHHAGENTANFTAINGIPHTHAHRPHSGVAYSGNTHLQHVDSNPEHSNWHSGSMQCADWKGHHFTTPRHHGSRVGFAHTNAHRNAGTRSHSGHLHAAGGVGGSAGRGAGTTAGSAGQSGGGGGIIVVTDAALIGVTTSTTGGTVGGNTASAGTALVIINT